MESAQLTAPDGSSVEVWGFAAKEGIRPSETTCPAMVLMAVLGGKWVLPILHCLDANGPARPRDIAEAIPGISAKELTKRVRQLEVAGIVSRRIDETESHRVVYGLTPEGSSILPAIQTLSRWAETHQRDLRQLLTKW